MDKMLILVKMVFQATLPRPQINRRRCVQNKNVCTMIKPLV
ncbi:Uncharacterised protein [Mycobacteroides abscessus subsp. massiliense]|nr:Uncharacterised protein [Mycobacteroides abscessus subsp. massiliense]